LRRGAASLTTLISKQAFAKFKEGLSQTKKDELFDTAYNLITPIAGVKGFRVGPPVTLALTQGFDFGISGFFVFFFHDHGSFTQPSYVVIGGEKIALSAEFDTIEAFKCVSPVCLLFPRAFALKARV
jgi:hypothetical protein